MEHFIQLNLCFFCVHAEEMASVHDVIYVKDEPLFPSLECDQVCSVFLMILMFIIDLVFLSYLNITHCKNVNIFMECSVWDSNRCPSIKPLLKTFNG